MGNHFNLHLIRRGAAVLFLFVLLAGCTARSPSVDEPSTAVTEAAESDSGAVTAVTQEPPVAAVDSENVVPADQSLNNNVVSYESSSPATMESQQSGYDRADVIWIQQRLKDLGYYEGPVDGSVGKATRGAVRDYQRDQDVTADGQPTTELREFMWLNGG